MRTHGMQMLLAVASTLIFSPVFAEMRPLFEIPIEGELPAEERIRDGLTIELYTHDGATLGDLLQIERDHIHPDRVDYPLRGYRPLKVDASRTWRESTFVVDVDEPDTRAMFEELIQKKGATPTREQLIEFVAATVEGSLGRGWDPASVVARNRTGDCTEYAVLLTALARATGRPARVVTGFVIVEAEGAPYAFGHAWSEVEDDGTWKVADAALLEAEADVIAYIPLGVLTNESSSYRLELIRHLQAWVQRVRLK